MDAKLHELTADGDFQLKVWRTLTNLGTHGENPKIFEAKRTVAQQKEKVRKGYSKTMFSYHLKRGSDDGARAADVADTKKGWNASKRFWLLLAANAQTRRLGWGGLFGLTHKQKRAVIAALDELREKGWPEDHSAYQVRIGWDPAHLEDKDNWPR